MGRKQMLIKEASTSYAELVAARKKHERVMLAARQTGATFTELAQALGLSEAAVRGYVHRAELRRRHE